MRVAEAAADLSKDRERFKRNVKTAMAGGRVGTETFDSVSDHSNNHG